MKPTPKTIEIKSGFYPSLVYLPLPNTLAQEPFLKQVQQILATNRIDHQPVEQLHISLTKTFYPIEPQIPKVISTLKEAVSSKRVRLPLVLLLQKVIVIDNFIAVEVGEVTAAKLRPIVGELAKIVKEQFYQKPIFHVSLCKVLGEVGQEVLQKLLEVQVPRSRAFVLEKCEVKTGKFVHRLN